MNKTISFKELVKLIHPDHNKDIVDAGGKMRQAVSFKNEPEELYKLAVRWGVLYNKVVKSISDNNTPVPTPVPPVPPTPVYRKIWVDSPLDEPVVGDYVRVLTLNIVVVVIRVTPQRVYFYRGKRRTFASKKNIIVMKEKEVEVK